MQGEPGIGQLGYTSYITKGRVTSCTMQSLYYPFLWLVAHTDEFILTLNFLQGQMIPEAIFTVYSN